MKKLINTLLLSAFALFGTVRANAAYNLTVNTWFNIPSLYGGSAVISTTGGSNWRNVNAGQFEVVFVGPAPTGYQPTFLSFCTDVDNWLSSGLFEPTLWAVAGTAPHNPAWSPNGTALASSIYRSWKDVVASDAMAVGVQLAIWDALQDNGDGPNAGLFRSQTDFNTYLLGPNNGPLLPAQIGTWWEPVNKHLNYRVGQGLIGELPDIPKVPEGENVVAGLALILIGGVGYRYYRRRP